MDAKYKIFKVFYELKEKKTYYNQIKEHSNLSHSSLQNGLKKLILKNILNENKTKSNVFYSLKNKKIAELEFSKIAIDEFENLNVDVKNPLRHFLENLPKNIFTIILFGSIVRKEERENSDIDLLIVSFDKVDLKTNIESAELTSRYPLSLFYCDVEEFVENKDPIIIQAKKTGFPIYREQNFYEVFLDEC
jgi:predicted nucleotidyltransferase